MSDATNTAPACNSCGERPREDRTGYCMRCAIMILRRKRREEAGETSPTSYDDDRRGK